MPTSQNRDMGHPPLWGYSDLGHPPVRDAGQAASGRVGRGGEDEVDGGTESGRADRCLPGRERPLGGSDASGLVGKGGPPLIAMRLR